MQEIQNVEFIQKAQIESALLKNATEATRQQKRHKQI
jgi:hypothetical protein